VAAQGPASLNLLASIAEFELAFTDAPALALFGRPRISPAVVCEIGVDNGDGLAQRAEDGTPFSMPPRSRKVASMTVGELPYRDGDRQAPGSLLLDRRLPLFLGRAVPNRAS
jgi:hypothetical protein